MFLCLRLFPPQRQSVEHILRSHLASKAPRYMSKFVGFGSVRSASGHCWEAIEAYSRGVPLVEGYSVEQVQSFTNLHGFFMPLFDGKSQEFLVIEIPVIPDIIRPIFPYESVTGPIQCADLVKYAAKELKLPYVPNLMLENKPSYADIYLEPNDTIPGDSILEEVLAKLGDDLGEVHWILLETSIPFTPDSDDIVSPTNSATRAMSNRLDSEGGRTTLSTQASRPKFDFKMPSEISEPKLVARKSTMQKSTVTPAESAVKPRNLVRASIRSSVAPKSTVHSIPDSAPSKLPPATPQEISGSEDALVPPPPPPPPPAPKAPLPRAAGYVPKKKNHKDAPPTKPVPNINSRLTTKSSSPPKKPVPNNPMPDPEVLVPVPPPAPPLV